MGWSHEFTEDDTRQLQPGIGYTPTQRRQARVIRYSVTCLRLIPSPLAASIIPRLLWTEAKIRRSLAD